MDAIVFLQATIFFCLSVCPYYISSFKYENETREQRARKKRDDYCQSQIYEQNITLCQTANLIMIPFADSDKKSITVTFGLNDTIKYKDCFPYYDIWVLNKIDDTRKEFKLYAYNFAGNNYSHTFENVPDGYHKIYIQPCYTKVCCANLSIFHGDFFNITSYNISSLSSTLEEPKDNSIVIYVVIGVAAGSLLLIFGLYYVTSNFKFNYLTDVVEDEEIDSVPVKVVVYIFHYYDGFGVNEQKVDCLRDFLIKTSLYDGVKTIQEELPSSLDNVHSWLSDVLNEKTQNLKIQKIIIIDSKEEDEEEAVENMLFNDFLAQLRSNLAQCLQSYDRIFVVQMEGISGSSDKLKNVVRGHRFNIPKHLIDLSLNLSAASKSNISSLKEHIEKIYMHHPIRHLNQE